MINTLKSFVLKYSAPLQLAVLLVMTYLLHNYNYLLFHSFAELISIVVAFAIFIMAWHSRSYFDNKIIFFIAMSMLPLAVVDSLHTFSFKGVSIFEHINANTPTQLWLIGRYFFSISLLAAPFVAEKIKKKENIFYGMLGAVVVILTSFFAFGFFPDAYVEGAGLTQFKIYSEYLIILVMAAAVYGLHLKRDRFDKEVYLYLRLAILSAVVSEFMFTLYFAVTDEFNLLGHIFKIITFFFLYAGVIEINLRQPHRLMFKGISDINAAKSEFMSVVSHQLKNPLSSILLSTDIMRMDKPEGVSSAERDEHLDTIRDAVFRMKKIIDDLLNITKIDMGVLGTKEDVIDAKTFIRSNLQEMEQITKAKKITITDNLEGKEFSKIKSDKQLLDIVFENILSNSIKYSREGGKVEISVTEAPEFVISVKDSGYGIPESQQAKIFKNSLRGDNVAQTIKDGSGLGLYMVKKITDKLGIGVSFDSKENEGTTFWLEFPKSRVVKNS